MPQLISKVALIDFITRVDADGGICFAIWSDEKQQVVDYKLSGCTPTGKDGCTRIGLTPIQKQAVKIMPTVTGLKEYTPSHDAIMNTPLEVVHGVYPEIWSKTPYSIKIPDSLAKVTIHQCMDGDQPSYDNRKISEALHDAGIESSTIADYPRHDNTLRLAFDDRETADKALAVLLSL